MKYQRNTIEFKNQQRINIALLVYEAISGVTKKDIIDNTGRCLWCHETEVMYFKLVRDFFENNISKIIMERNQDNHEVKILKKY